MQTGKTNIVNIISVILKETTYLTSTISKRNLE